MTIFILADASNILKYSNIDGNRIANAQSLEAVQSYLIFLESIYPEIRVLFLADASLKYRIDDKDWYLKQLATQDFVECPAGHTADEFLLDAMQNNPFEVIILSNDRFLDHQISPIFNQVQWRFRVFHHKTRVYIPGLHKMLQYEFETKPEMILHQQAKIAEGKISAMDSGVTALSLLIEMKTLPQLAQEMNLAIN